MRNLFCNYIFIFVFGLEGISQSEIINLDPFSVDSSVAIAKKLIGSSKFLEAEKIMNGVCNDFTVKGDTDNLSYAKGLHWLARAQQGMHLYSTSEANYLKSLTLKRKLFGDLNAEVATTLVALGNLHSVRSSFQQAMEFYGAAIKIRESVFGEESAEYASSLVSLGLCYLNLNNIEKAEELYVRALGIQKKILKKDHPDYLQSLNNLMVLYANKYAFAKAIMVGEEAKVILEQLRDTVSENYARIIDNLAVCYSELGNFKNAEFLHLKAIGLKEILYGTEDKEYARSLNNLGKIYFDLNIVDVAKHYILKAYQIIQKAGNENDETYIHIVNNLGSVYWYLSDFNRASELFMAVMHLMEKIEMTHDPAYSAVIANLANLFEDQNKINLADSFYRKAINICLETFGQKDILYCVYLNNYGVFLYEQNRFNEALSFYNEAQVILEDLNRRNNPTYVLLLHNRFKLFWKIGNYKDARKEVLKFCHFKRELTDYSIAYLDADKLAKIVSSYEDDISRIISFILEMKNEHDKDELMKELANEVLTYKNISRDLISILGKQSALDSSRRLLSQELHLISRKIGDFGLTFDDTLELNNLNIEYEAKSSRLRHMSFELDRDIRPVEWREVSSALDSNEIAIEFIRFQHFAPEKRKDSLYAALIIQSGGKLPELVLLGKQAQLDPLISHWLRGSCFSRDISETLHFKKIMSSLYEFIIRPMNEKLQNIDRIYYAGAGDLYFINFNLLIDPALNCYLSDKYDFRMLSTIREVIGFNSSKWVPISVVAFGDVDYDQGLGSYSEITNDERSYYSVISIDLVSNLEKESAAGSTREGRRFPKIWKKLKFSRQELSKIREVARLSGLRYSEFTKEMAAKEHMWQLDKTQSSSCILHISTHGFYYPFKTHKEEGDGKSKSYIVEGRVLEPPLLRTGLVFSGVNCGSEDTTGSHGMILGLLTSEEIAKMNLTHIGLVVLSACETGLGDVTSYEGVHGLQRAFKIAGVKEIIMSLWQVDDEATSRLMSEMYTNLLIRKQGPKEALLNAQHFMSKQKVYGNPYYWAGWILLE